MVGPYATLRALVSAPQSTRGITIGNLMPAAAQEALCSQGLALAAEATSAIDQLLLQASTERADQPSLLSLRCRASHPIEQQVRSLHGRWGESHRLDLLEMASRVLDDDGRLLSWTAPGEAPPPGHVPFALQVLGDWRPEVAGLDRWCRVRVQSDPGLRQLLLGHGLLLMGPWALLAAASRRRVEAAWHAYGQGGFTAAKAIELHATYQIHYREAKQLHRERFGRSRGWTPSGAFLLRLQPDQSPADTLDRLQAIASALRHFGLEGPPMVPEQSMAANDGDGNDELSAFATLVESALRRACQRHRPNLLGGTGGEGRRLLQCLWQAYGEGLSQRATAERCGCSQAMVSRRLQLQRHAIAIATAAAKELGRHPVMASRLATTADWERLVAALSDHLLAAPPDDRQPRLALWLELSTLPGPAP
jgi:hypothetical protein